MRNADDSHPSGWMLYQTYTARCRRSDAHRVLTGVGHRRQSGRALPSTEGNGFTRFVCEACRDGESRWSPWRSRDRDNPSIELGTAVLQDISCHPCCKHPGVPVGLRGDEPTGFALGIGPSHEALIRGCLRPVLRPPGRSTEGVGASASHRLFRGEDSTSRATMDRPQRLPDDAAWPTKCGFCLSALCPRLLRIAVSVRWNGFLWMAQLRARNARYPEMQRRPLQRGAQPRIPSPACRLASTTRRAGASLCLQQRVRSAVYAGNANYQRIMDIGGLRGRQRRAIVGIERVGHRQAACPVDAGRHPDICAQRSFPVGSESHNAKPQCAHHGTSFLVGYWPYSFGKVPSPSAKNLLQMLVPYFLQHTDEGPRPVCVSDVYESSSGPFFATERHRRTS